MTNVKEIEKLVIYLENGFRSKGPDMRQSYVQEVVSFTKFLKVKVFYLGNYLRRWVLADND